VSWFRLRVEATAQREEAVAALFAAGAQGVHEDGALLVTHFEAEELARAAAAAVVAVAPATTCQVEPSSQVDWTTAWRDHARVFALERLTIAPPWLAGDVDPARLVVIDPGMAFGTGDHASTRGAARLLESAMRPGLTVADLGAGSAIQAIVAARLGAARVWAIESDPDAQGNAAANVARNGVSTVVHLLEGDAALMLPLVAPVDIIVANIISSVIRALLPAMAQVLTPGGVLILAGILVSERDEMVQVLADSGWTVRAEDREEEWWSTMVARA
jgi:ribosomal protein L11 methyltransferase